MENNEKAVLIFGGGLLVIGSLSALYFPHVLNKIEFIRKKDGDKPTDHQKVFQKWEAGKLLVNSAMLMGTIGLASGLAAGVLACSSKGSISK